MRRPSSCRPGRAGFALVDVSIALAILAIALGTLVGSIFWAMRLEEANAETAAASQRLQALLEGLQGRPIEELYAMYNADPADDPEPGRDYLAELAVTEPILTVGKKTPPVVRVSFPENAAGLDPDQTTLAVVLRLEWEGAAGPRAMEIGTRVRP